ncbi:zinc finger protein 25-like protein [Leptotrombidium deliense]|uniref:Zinc finger protein 25-like protein n=1 Tax=Leptotrombidium deliense TaxID=299467 RepID=A0A443SUK5_9ACAR|nr:zinc finger protein 25-like protein [Leptotrombidium deliense]
MAPKRRKGKNTKNVVSAPKQRKNASKPVLQTVEPLNTVELFEGIDEKCKVDTLFPLETIETEVITVEELHPVTTEIRAKDTEKNYRDDESRVDDNEQTEKSISEEQFDGENEKYAIKSKPETGAKKAANRKKTKRCAKSHESSHTDGDESRKPLPCGDCGLEFADMHSLVVHEVTAHEDKGFRCHVCDKVFTRKYHLDRHLMLTPCSGQPPPAHPCEVCGKVYTRKDNLREHLRVHAGEVTRKKKFKKARLQMHTRYVHEKDRPFECVQCSKKFTRKEDLNRHFVLHTGEKPHQCPTCFKRFAIKPSLKLHLLTHTKEEPRSCHECGRAFIRKDCLLRHMRKRHRDLLDKISLDDKDEEEEEDDSSTSPISITTTSSNGSKILSEHKLCESIKELLSLLVDESTLKSFGWPETPVDQLLESVIKRCGHTPVKQEDFAYYDRLRENSKLLFTVVIDDNAVKTLLNNQTVDEVILHVLRLAKS